MKIFYSIFKTSGAVVQLLKGIAALGTGQNVATTRKVAGGGNLDHHVGDRVGQLVADYDSRDNDRVACRLPLPDRSRRASEQQSATTNPEEAQAALVQGRTEPGLPKV